MKKLLLATIATLSLNANATWPSDALTQSQYQFQQANGGDASVGFENNDRLQIPNIAPSIAPSQSINANCQIATPQSSSFNTFLFGFSKTDGVKYNALCLAHYNGDKELVHQIACDTLPEYKAANLKLGRECK